MATKNTQPKDNATSKDDPFVLAVHKLISRKKTKAAAKAGGAWGGAQSSAVANEFYASRRVQRILGEISANEGLLDEKDELMQGVVVVMFDKIFPVLDKAENVYTVLYATAERVAKGMKRTLITKSGRYESFDEFEGTEGRPMEDVVFSHDGHDRINVDDEFTERLDEEIDRKRALAELTKRLAISRPQELTPKEQTKPAKTAVKRELCAAAKELIEIRKQLDLSTKEMASALGILHATLCAYIYGRTKDVPAPVIGKAREMQSEQGDIKGRLDNRFGTTEMCDLLKGWCKSLKININDIEQVATAFGVRPVTINRWLVNETRPSLRQLQRYDQMVYSKTR